MARWSCGLGWGALAMLMLLPAACGDMDFLNHRPGVHRVEPAPVPRAAETRPPARITPVPRRTATPAPRRETRPAIPRRAPPAPLPPPQTVGIPVDSHEEFAPGGPRVLAGNATSVAVGPVDGIGDQDARARAVARCRSEGRRAVLPRMSGEEIVVYQCAR